MQNLEQSSVWELIKAKLLDMQKNATEGLQQLKNSHEEDIAYKARLAVVKELLSLPQTLQTPGVAAKLQRTHG